MAIKTVSFQVRGRVQGVGFRWSARAEALNLGLVGWVRNEPDGSLTVVAQGEDAAVESFATWLAEGPVFAKVRQVIRAELHPIALRDFQVRG